MTAEAPRRGLNVRTDIAPPQAEPTDPLTDIRTRFAHEIEILGSQDHSKDKIQALEFFFRYLVAHGIPKPSIAEAFNVGDIDVVNGIKNARAVERSNAWREFINNLGFSALEKRILLYNETRDIFSEFGVQIPDDKLRRLIGGIGDETTAHQETGFSRFNAPAFEEEFGVTRIRLTEYVRTASVQFPEHVIFGEKPKPARVTSLGIAILKDKLAAHRPPENFIYFPASEIAKKYHIMDTTLRVWLKKPKTANPSHFRKEKRANNFFNFVTPEGLLLVLAGRQVLTVREGNIVIDPQKLGTEFSISSRTVNECAKELAKIYPDDFSIKGQGHLHPDTTPKGMELLRNRLAQAGIPPATIEVDYDALSAEYSVGRGIIEAEVKRIKERDKITFQRRGSGRPVVATPDGMEKLREALSSLATPPGYTRVNIGILADQYHLTDTKTRGRLAYLMKRRPELFLRRIERKGIQPVDASEEGMKLFLVMLAKK